MDMRLLMRHFSRTTVSFYVLKQIELPTIAAQLQLTNKASVAK